MNIKIVLIALMSTVISYLAVNEFIIELSFWKWLGIEFITTIMHFMYTLSKKDIQTKQE